MMICYQRLLHALLIKSASCGAWQAAFHHSEFPVYTRVGKAWNRTGLPVCDEDTLEFAYQILAAEFPDWRMLPI
jgi:hypothetical protein